MSDKMYCETCDVVKVDEEILGGNCGSCGQPLDETPVECSKKDRPSYSEGICKKRNRQVES